MKVWFILISILFGYLMGSISFAVIISRLKGVDIRKVGTGNPGAANVFRQVGKKYGIVVWILDTLKGVFPMIVAGRVFHLPLLAVAATGSAAIAGHCWSIFLRFKGGKGVATMGGVTLYLLPFLFPLGAILYFWVQKTGRRPSIIYTAFLIFFLSCYFLYRRGALVIFLPPSQFVFSTKPYLEILLSLIILFAVALLANVSTIREIRKQWSSK